MAVLPYSATKTTTIFRIAREQAGPDGREGTPVRIRRTISTQASMGWASRKSEFPPSEERLGLGEGTSLLASFGASATATGMGVGEAWE